MSDAEGNAVHYLTFDIASERYAIDVAAVEVVLEMIDITRVPKSAPQLRGVINHRGSVIPVVDLKVVFGMEPTEISGDTAVVVTQVELDSKLITAGFLADAVHEVIDLDKGFLAPSASFGVRSDGAFVQGIGQRGSDFIVLLDLKKAIATFATSDGDVQKNNRE